MAEGERWAITGIGRVGQVRRVGQVGRVAGYGPEGRNGVGTEGSVVGLMQAVAAVAGETKATDT